jgi:hypothetical protein
MEVFVTNPNPASPQQTKFFHNLGLIVVGAAAGLVVLLALGNSGHFSGQSQVALTRSADWLGGSLLPIIRIFLCLAAIFAAFYFLFWKKVVVPMFKTGDGKPNPAGIVFAVIVIISILAALSPHH